MPRMQIELDALASVLDAYDAETKKLPLGHEMPTRGASTYNWRRAIVDDLRAMLSAAPAVPSPTAGSYAGMTSLDVCLETYGLDYMQRHHVFAKVGALLDRAALTRETEPGEPVAWRGWWAGAGSVDSETHFTTSETRANQWREAGAEVTPLYTSEAAVPSGEKLTAYELQVLIGTSISGCMMPPDRVFDLKAAWAKLRTLGLIDRSDGLAIATDTGTALIASVLSRAMIAARPKAVAAAIRKATP